MEESASGSLRLFQIDLRSRAENVRAKRISRKTCQCLNSKDATDRYPFPLGNSLTAHAAQSFGKSGWTTGPLLSLFANRFHDDNESISFLLMQAYLSMKGCLSSGIVRA